MNSNRDQLLIQFMLEDLKGQASTVLDKPVTKVEAALPELGFGLQSLAAFVDGMNGAYGLNVPAGILLEHSTLNAFAGYLLGNHGPAILDKFGLGDVVQAPVAQAVETEAGTVDLGLSAQAMAEQMKAEIVAIAADLLAVPASELDPDGEIIDLGFDSITATKFAGRVGDKFDITIHPGVFFEYTTLNTLTGYLQDAHSDAVEAHYNPAQTPNPAPLRAAAVKPQPRVPVVIGTGITGLFISRALSKEKIPHIMLGDPMIGDTPKLGESMNESASIDLLQEFSEFSEYFFEKKEINFYSGNMTALLNLRGKKGHAFYDAYERLGFNPQTEYANMIHIDRLGFDRALYHQVSNSPYCEVIPHLKVTGLDYDEAADTIDKIILENGRELLPSYVFDATNHVRLLGKLLKIEADLFDDPRHIFFTHYAKTDAVAVESCDEGPAWLHATNVLQLEQDVDGIEGVAWCIPEGDYVSVGISVDSAKAADMQKEQVIELLNRAYQKRGLDYLEKFPKQRQIMVIPGTRHFIHKRIAGKNWLMSGGSACQVWFLSGSNIFISLLASKIAPKLIHDDADKWLQIYQQITTNLAKLHWTYDRWSQGQYRSRKDLGLFAKDIYSFGNKRMALYALVRNKPEFEEAAREVAASQIPDYAMLSQELRIVEADDLGLQTQKLDKARASLLNYMDKLTPQEESVEEDVFVEVV